MGWKTLPAQNLPYSLDNLDKKKVEIPFEYENHFIIIKLRFNNFLNTRFIFDTGAEHTIITKKDILKFLPYQYVREIKIVGADLSQTLKAHLIAGMNFTTGNLGATYQPVLVLEEDYFRFEEYTGLQIHGILGANIFRNFVVQIDYKRKVITLTKPNLFTPPGKNFKKVPIKIHKNKPYLAVDLKMNRDSQPIPAKLLLDTGASLALMLHNNSHPSIKLPEMVVKGNIGKGLGGYLEGYLGRTQEIAFSGFEMQEVLTNFQELSGNIDSNLIYSRNGILGNKILERFEVILDYQHEIAYMRPNNNYKAPFEFDKSGLVIVAGGANLNQFTIQSVVANSPAAEAGLKDGDTITNINGWPVWLYSLENISSRLSKKEGNKVRLTIRRDDQKHKYKFVLRRLI
ncbi:MAG: aspartyl protease family protein [Saprospiraceae bacterium]|nr:aspartyl protease family protein [Saprospiraceae bacterium]